MSKSVRASKGIGILLSYVAWRAKETRDMNMLLESCGSLQLIRHQCASAEMCYHMGLIFMPSLIPPLCAFSRTCAGHAILRATAHRNRRPLRNLLHLIEREMSYPLERTSMQIARVNMQAVAICLHKCTVVIEGRPYLVSLSEVPDISILASIGNSLLSKYAILTYDTNVEYIAVGLLECIYGYQFDENILQRLLGRFCECVTDGYDLMALFVHHALLRLLDNSCSHNGAAVHMLTHGDVGHVLTCVFTAATVSSDAHAASASLISEMINTTRLVDLDTFLRAEQVAYVMMQPDQPGAVREVYAHMLSRAILCFDDAGGGMDNDAANRALCMLAEAAVVSFDPRSPVQEHILEAVSHLALVRRPLLTVASYSFIALLAVRVCTFMGDKMPARALYLLLCASRYLEYGQLLQVLQKCTVLSASLRDPSYVVKHPGNVVLVLKIIRAFLLRTGVANTAPARQVEKALDLTLSIQKLCATCIDSSFIARSAAGRSLMQFVARTLFVFMQFNIFTQADMQVMALRIASHSIRTSPHNVHNTHRAHRTIRLFMNKTPLLAPLARNGVLKDLVESLTMNESESPRARISTLLLLRDMLRYNDHQCMCICQRPVLCSITLLYCLRTLTYVTANKDMQAFIIAQNIIYIVALCTSHAPDVQHMTVQVKAVNALILAHIALEKDMSEAQRKTSLDYNACICEKTEKKI